jgi:predicted GTPase
MNVVTKFRSILRGGESAGILSPEELATIESAFDGELARPPRIAVIGETGVGKSTTLNVLFNAGLEVSHTTACTQLEIEKEVEVRGGLLRIVDLPGLGRRDRKPLAPSSLTRLPRRNVERHDRERRDRRLRPPGSGKDGAA